MFGGDFQVFGDSFYAFGGSFLGVRWCSVVKKTPIFHVFHFIRKPPKNYYFVKKIISDKSLKLAIYIFGN